MENFKNIAKLLREKRQSHPKKYTQSQVGNAIDCKGGQFISNIERGRCSLPPVAMKKVAELLDITQEEIFDAIIADYREDLKQMYSSENGNNQANTEVKVRPVLRLVS